MNLKDALNNPDAILLEDDTVSPPRHHLLAIWRYPRTNDFSPYWEAANGARGAVQDFFIRKGNILANERITDAAKMEDLKEAAVIAIREIGQQQRKLNEAAIALKDERMELAKVDPAAPADAIVDIDIARHLRELVGDAREKFIGHMVAGAEPRAVDAVIRLPAFLTGLTDQMVAVIQSAAIERNHPDKVMRLESLEQAAQTAQSVLKQCGEALEAVAGLQLGELLAAYGDGAWEHFVKGDPAALAAIARRHVAVADAE